MIEDLNVEDDESFTIRLVSPENTLIGDGIGLGTILNDEDNITADIDDVSVVEGDPGDAVTLDFTVSLSAPPTKPAAVSFATQNGTAIRVQRLRLCHRFAHLRGRRDEQDDLGRGDRGPER